MVKTAAFSLLSLAVLVLALLAFAMPAPEVEAPAVPAFPERLADLPLTNHAEHVHADDLYNAQNLPEMFDNGKCKSYSIAYCPHDQAWHVVCEIQKEFYAGIIVGMAIPDCPVIVTAYPARLAYWKKNANGCIDMTFPPGGLVLP